MLGIINIAGASRSQEPQQPQDVLNKVEDFLKISVSRGDSITIALKSHQGYEVESLHCKKIESNLKFSRS